METTNQGTTKEAAKPEIMTIPGHLDVSYRYAAGATGSEFLRRLRDEKRISGVQCPRCRRAEWQGPARHPRLPAPVQHGRGHRSSGRGRAPLVEAGVGSPVQNYEGSRAWVL